MNVQPQRILNFQKQWAMELRAFLATPCGQATIQECRKLRPSPYCESVAHQPVYRLGSIAGYEQYEANLITLSTVIPEGQPAPEITYGIKEPKDN